MLSAVLACMLAVAVPSLASAPAFRLPQPAVRTLPNGITVAVFHDARLPLVQVQITEPAGSAAEGSLPPGVAYVTSQMIGHATASRDPQAMHDDLDRAGGRLTTRIGRDVSVVSASFLAAELPSGMELLSDAVQNALFTSEDFMQARRAAYALANGPAGAMRQAEDRLWRSAFGDGAYGHEPGGTVESLERMTLADVRAFANAHWGPQGAVIAIAGDVEPDSALALAADAFGGWTPREATPVPAALSPSTRAMHLIVRPDAARCEIWIGVPGPRAGEPDEVAVALASQLAARAPAAPPGMVTGQSELHRAGFVWASATARPDSAAIVAHRLEEALLSVRNSAGSDPDVDGLKRAVLSSFPMRFETLAGVADQWSAEAALGLGFDDLVRFPARMQATSGAAVAAAARKWFDPSRMTFVVAGPVDRVRTTLAAIAPLASSGAANELPVTPAMEKQGRELVTKAVVAHGGLVALRKVRESLIEADATVQIGSREAKAHVGQTRKEPDRMLYDLKFEDSGGSREVLAGTHGWRAPIDTLQKVTELDSAAVASLREGFRGDVLHLLLDAADPATRTVARGTERANGGTYEKVEIWGSDGSHRTLYFDPGTRLLAGIELNDSGDRDSGISSRRWYRDYRAVNGIRLPFAEDRWLGGQRVMQLEITRYELNSGVPDALFQRPEPSLPPPSR